MASSNLSPALIKDGREKESRRSPENAELSASPVNATHAIPIIVERIDQQLLLLPLISGRVGMSPESVRNCPRLVAITASPFSRGFFKEDEARFSLRESLKRRPSVVTFKFLFLKVKYVGKLKLQRNSPSLKLSSFIVLVKRLRAKNFSKCSATSYE